MGMDRNSAPLFALLDILAQEIGGTHSYGYHQRNPKNEIPYEMFHTPSYIIIARDAQAQKELTRFS